MLSKRVLLTLIASCLAGLALPAAAVERTAFSQAGFEAAQNAGRPILVEITAPWCPTCKAQKPILGALFDSPEFSKMAVFDIDFDTQKDLVRAFKAQMQSTLICFKGTQEVGRSVGDTKPASIKGLLDRSL